MKKTIAIVLAAAGMTGCFGDLYQWREKASTWTAVANLGAFGLRDVTRLAVSPKGDRPAIVASAK